MVRTPQDQLWKLRYQKKIYSTGEEGEKGSVFCFFCQRAMHTICAEPRQRAPSKKKIDEAYNLIVATVGLALCIEDTLPVLLLELSLGVDVNQHLNVAALLAHLGHPHTLLGEDGADKAS